MPLWVWMSFHSVLRDHLPSSLLMVCSFITVLKSLWEFLLCDYYAGATSSGKLSSFLSQESSSCTGKQFAFIKLPRLQIHVAPKGPESTFQGHLVLALPVSIQSESYWRDLIIALPFMVAWVSAIFALLLPFSDLLIHISFRFRHHHTLFYFTFLLPCHLYRLIPSVDSLLLWNVMWVGHRETRRKYDLLLMFEPSDKCAVIKRQRTFKEVTDMVLTDHDVHLYLHGDLWTRGPAACT